MAKTHVDIFREGFKIGSTMPASALGLIELLYCGATGTSAELAKLTGKVRQNVSGMLWRLHCAGMVHIVRWERGGVAVFAYGAGEDALKPTPRDVNACRTEARAEREAKKIEAKKAKHEAFIERTTPKQIDIAENMRRTGHGHETKQGAVRIHRMI